MFRSASRPAATLGLSQPPVVGLLALLLIVDGVLILLYWSLATFGEPSNAAFDIEVDRSYGEFFQYVQTIWAGSLAALLAVRKRVAVLGAWALVCAFFLVDDWFQLHERAGFWFGDRFPAFGDVGHHLGELVWVGGVGLLLILGVWFTNRRASAEWRSVTAVLVVLFGLLSLTGIVVDFVHEVILDFPGLGVPLTTLEDGGEIVAMSLVVTFLFAVATSGHRPVVGPWLARLVGASPNTSDRAGPRPVEAPGGLRG